MTTYRRLAESMLEKIEEHHGQARRRRGRRSPCCRAAISPTTGFEARAAKLKAVLSLSRPCLMRGRPTRLYGTTRRTLLGLARIAGRSRPQLRRRPVSRRKCAILIEHEWARDRRGRAVAPHQARPAADRRKQAAALDKWIARRSTHGGARNNTARAGREALGGERMECSN